MGSKGKKRCGWLTPRGRCTNLVTDGKNQYCDHCKPEYLKGFRQRSQQGDYSNLYRTTGWKRLREAQLAQSPLCHLCSRPGGVVDHIRPHRGNLDAFCDSNNLMTLCKRCHDQVTQREIRWRKQGLSDHQIGERKKIVPRVVSEKVTLVVPTQNG